jgi:hypothetical protein
VQVAFDDFGAERPNPIGPFIESVDESAYGVAFVPQ